MPYIKIFESKILHVDETQYKLYTLIFINLFIRFLSETQYKLYTLIFINFFIRFLR
jgi:hypothetical protein